MAERDRVHRQARNASAGVAVTSTVVAELDRLGRPARHVLVQRDHDATSPDDILSLAGLSQRQTIYQPCLTPR